MNGRVSSHLCRLLLVTHYDVAHDAVRAKLQQRQRENTCCAGFAFQDTFTVSLLISLRCGKTLWFRGFRTTYMSDNAAMLPIWLGMEPVS